MECLGSIRVHLGSSSRAYLRTLGQLEWAWPNIRLQARRCLQRIASKPTADARHATHAFSNRVMACAIRRRRSFRKSSKRSGFQRS